jgi:hypothetical protein
MDRAGELGRLGLLGTGAGLGTVGGLYAAFNSGSAPKPAQPSGMKKAPKQPTTIANQPTKKTTAPQPTPATPPIQSVNSGGVGGVQMPIQDEFYDPNNLTNLIRKFNANR